MVVELTRHISTLANFPATDVVKIGLALDEAVTNVIKHSLKHRETELITIEYFVVGNGLKIRLIYGGVPPRIADEEISLEHMVKERKKGGLGVQLMKKIMDSVDYKTINGTNFCEMTKWLKAG